MIIAEIQISIQRSSSGLLTRSVWSLCSCHGGDGDARPEDGESLQDAHSKGDKSIWVAPNVNCSCRWRKESLTYLQYSTRQTSLSFTTTGSLTFRIFWTQCVNSGRKTIRAFRRKDGKLIANFRVQVSLLHLNLSSVYLFSMFFTLGRSQRYGDNNRWKV